MPPSISRCSTRRARVVEPEAPRAAASGRHQRRVQPSEGYGNWFWGLTPSCLESLLKTAGFRVDFRATEAFAQTCVCAAVAPALEHQLPGSGFGAAARRRRFRPPGSRGRHSGGACARCLARGRTTARREPRQDRAPCAPNLVQRPARGRRGGFPRPAACRRSPASARSRRARRACSSGVAVAVAAASPPACRAASARRRAHRCARAGDSCDDLAVVMTTVVPATRRR